jgi:hypothetical protein
MKKKSGKKLNLLKSTVTTLTEVQKNRVQGGDPDLGTHTGWKTCSRKLTTTDTEIEKG